MLRYLVLTLTTLALHAGVGTSFDPGWRFLKADASGAQAPEFPDQSWRPLNLPHDWAIEGPFDAKNPAGGAGAFLPGGVGWYRKHFVLPAVDSNKRVFIDFDGVMANSDVWINGFHLGKRPYGYVSFRYELTGHLNFVPGPPNVIAVRVDDSAQPASRWYPGAGIYRHVRLVVTDLIHFEHWATFVTTPRITASEARVAVQSRIVNQSAIPRGVSLEVSLFGPDGKLVKTAITQSQALAAGQAVDVHLEMAVASPELWNLEQPNLYRAVAKVRAGPAALDEETVAFGIRDAHFDAATGFWLNGRNFKVKGVCLHADAGGLGAAIPLRAWERRLEQLRKLGVNAIRTAHNPPAPEFLDLCDRMGFLVMDEMFDQWTVAKNPYDYHLYFREWSQIDTRDTVMRDRNHPSIILYSAGNEIHDTPKADLAKEILKGLVDTFHLADPTRPVTQALFRPNVSHDYDDGLADLLDVVGQNYRENEILAAHAAKPTRKIIGTENQHGRDVWVALRDNAAYAGQFLWAGIDYLGESRAWPLIGDSFGLLDRTGEVKPMGYERQSWWSEKPMVYVTRRVAPVMAAATDPGYEQQARRSLQTLYPDWTPANTTAHEETVEVYSNCEDVELRLNGKSLGSKPLAANAAARVWRVAYEAGRLEAVGKNQGKTAATFELRTAGKPAKIVLSNEHPRIALAWDDVAYITATIVDANGVQVASADAQVQFKISGPGLIAAVDNADNASHEAFQAAERRAFQGRCVAVVRATSLGRFTFTASSAGIGAASTTVESVR
ncbi:MAG TPA: glycoside hydrolase family 2 TIM barrel-domain containing protein [Candidatus Sulfopaludibacter sp.]|nr:glycoside hydrolase family 2 TIM barrel-domain containing protein [Candidatus Sulfopaludibacter sp.]